jgi:hypothetical protein
MEASVLVEKAALWKRPYYGKSRIVEKAVLWKSEKYAKKIWHAGVNKNTPPFR